MSFDRDRLLEATGGDKNLARELVEILINEIPDSVARIDEAIKVGDFRKLQSNSHTLRGPLGTVGADREVELAQELEKMARLGDIGSAATVFEKLRTALKGLAAELEVSQGTSLL
jgi:HPt (histidine-containing phosphotransfer) domain-containing protein